PLLARRLGLLEVLGQEVHIEDDRRERILDLVSQRTGEPRDLRILLGESLAEFLLGELMFRFHAYFAGGGYGERQEKTRRPQGARPSGFSIAKSERSETEPRSERERLSCRPA